MHVIIKSAELFVLEMGVRDLTAKYANEYMSSKFRRHRADDEWLKSTFNAKVFLLRMIACVLLWS